MGKLHITEYHTVYWKRGHGSATPFNNDLDEIMECLRQQPVDSASAFEGQHARVYVPRGDRFLQTKIQDDSRIGDVCVLLHQQ